MDPTPVLWFQGYSALDYALWGLSQGIPQAGAVASYLLAHYPDMARQDNELAEFDVREWTSAELSWQADQPDWETGLFCHGDFSATGRPEVEGLLDGRVRGAGSVLGDNLAVCQRSAGVVTRATGQG